MRESLRLCKRMNVSHKHVSKYSVVTGHHQQSLWQWNHEGFEDGSAALFTCCIKIVSMHIVFVVTSFFGLEN